MWVKPVSTTARMGVSWHRRIARASRAREWSEIRCSALMPGSRWLAEDDGDVVARATGGGAQACRGGAITQHGQAWVMTQQRGGRVGSDRALKRRAQRFGLVLAGHDEQDLPCRQQRPRADGQRLGGDALGAAEVAGRCGDRGRVERHAPHTVGGTRAGLVEGDVRVASEPEHREVDGRGVKDRLVADRLCLGVERGAVEGFAPADAEAGELAVERGAETARVVLPEAKVLIEPEHGHMIGGQRAVGGVVAQRRIEPNRRTPGREEHAHVSARADTVGDQFGRGQPDVMMIVEDHQ